LTASFLHVGFSQWAISTVGLLIVGSIFEGSGMGKIKMFVFFVVTSLAAQCFSLLCGDAEAPLTVGGSGVLFGMLGGLLALTIVNFQALEKAGPLRICIIFMVVFLLIILLIISVGEEIGHDFKSGDVYGNMGGFFGGIFFGMLTVPAVRQSATRAGSYEGKIRKIGGGLSLLYFGIIFTLLYTIKDDFKCFSYYEKC